MKNPWKLRPVFICATPVVGALVQTIILGFSTGRAENGHRAAIYNAITFLILLFPLISLPALSAAVGGLKTKSTRGWYLAGAVLNAVYCLLLQVPILTLATIVMHRAKG
jgi:hypothetical protein